MFFSVLLPPIFLLFSVVRHSFRWRRRRISIFIKISVAYDIDRIVFFQMASQRRAERKNEENMCQMHTPRIQEARAEI